MLKEITIRRIALIDELTIEWQGGFQVITGETGAGKSIVVGALAFLLGEPHGRDLLQTGAPRGGVTAVFDVSGLVGVRALLDERELEIDDGFLVLSRELFANGRTVCRAAGEAMPLALFRRITAMLVDLHGQHAHQVLLDPKSHLAFLDAFGDVLHAADLVELRARHRAWRDAKRNLERLLTDAQERARRLDMLRFQLQELTDARLIPDEETALEEERTRARYAEKIHAALNKADTLLSGGDGARSPGVCAPLKQAVALLGGIEAYDPRVSALAERLESLGYEVEDAAGELSRLIDESPLDPKRIGRVESRLDLLHRLMRKYGASSREMIEYRQRVAGELEETLDADARADQFRQELSAMAQEYLALAAKVSQTRHVLSEAFSERMTAELAQLGMERARFAVGFDEGDGNSDGSYREDGVDRAQFLISANAGEPLKPLAAIASGGELSRVMLAVKSIAADHSGVPVVIFDEIDTGISGRMAQAVAEKMAAIARHNQVICVTHLPQIAAMADTAYRVEKTVEMSDGFERTRTTLERLDGAERTAELARMLGGADPESEDSLKYAAALLDSARNWRAGKAVG
ncbi:DNA repair protein RecN [Clostridia bacterium]|nr:DNA repair protein RecN [Clostridia bacterium]